eukprot:4490370-Lingulodinium_polyedra.AAC.1
MQPLHGPDPRGGTGQRGCPLPRVTIASVPLALCPDPPDICNAHMELGRIPACCSPSPKVVAGVLLQDLEELLHLTSQGPLANTPELPDPA